jgi:hypothetical protein
MEAVSCIATSKHLQQRSTKNYCSYRKKDEDEKGMPETENQGASPDELSMFFSVFDIMAASL